MMLAVKTGPARRKGCRWTRLWWTGYAAHNDDTFKVLPTLLGNIQNNAIFMKPGDFTWWLYLDTVSEGEMPNRLAL